MVEEIDAKHEEMVEEFWRTWAMEGPPQDKLRKIRFFRFLPAEARCKFCYAPLDFGTVACVGCGRCIDVCPVGIDIAEMLGDVVRLEIDI